MTIANSSTILAADLNGMLTTSMGLLVTDNGQAPAGLLHVINFDGISASANAERCRTKFVAPCDLIVETLAVYAAGMTPASTLTVSFTGDGILSDWAHEVTGTVGTSFAKLSRLLFDGSVKTKPNKNPTTTSRAPRVFTKGSTITVSASTTSVASGTKAGAVLLYREFFQRI